MSAFPELNVRTYVRVHEKPGVYFFSLDAGNLLAVLAARLLGLPYYRAAMRVRAQGTRVRYQSRRRGRSRAVEFVADYEPTGPVFSAPPGPRLTGRHCCTTGAGSA